MLCKPQIAFLRESILSILGVEPPSLFYIGGSDVLPPPLEKAEESDALAALEAGDARARSLLIEHNLRLVVYISKHFENTGVNIEDLISIGTIGLIKAVNTFNNSKNIKLATYASRCIENEILMVLRKGASRSISLSASSSSGRETSSASVPRMSESSSSLPSQSVLSGSSKLTSVFCAPSLRRYMRISFSIQRLA